MAAKHIELYPAKPPQPGLSQRAMVVGVRLRVLECAANESRGQKPTDCAVFVVAMSNLPAVTDGLDWVTANF